MPLIELVNSLEKKTQIELAIELIEIGLPIWENYNSENRFQKVDYIVKLNDKNNLHFMSLGFKDYESFVGVQATIIKEDNNTKKEFDCSDWILLTRTRSGGSYEDKAKQNEIIKSARRQYSGTFYNDWCGTNRYTN